MKDLFSLTIGVVSIIVLVIVIQVIWERAVCNEKWASFPHKYGIASGCQIELDGKWIPAESYYFKEE